MYHEVVWDPKIFSKNFTSESAWVEDSIGRQDCCTWSSCCRSPTVWRRQQQGGEEGSAVMWWVWEQQGGEDWAMVKWENSSLKFPSRGWRWWRISDGEENFSKRLKQSTNWNIYFVHGFVVKENNTSTSDFTAALYVFPIKDVRSIINSWKNIFLNFWKIICLLKYKIPFTQVGNSQSSFEQISCSHESPHGTAPKSNARWHQEEVLYNQYWFHPVNHYHFWNLGWWKNKMRGC